LKTVTLLGMAISRNLCPFTGEVWGVNNGYRQAKAQGGHLDKLFLAHGQVIDGAGDENFNWNEINATGIQVIGTHIVPELKNYSPYPYEQIVKEFGTDYFSDTICYMLAYAIYRGYDRIYMYGVDMMTTGEYWEEKGGVEYWIGFARGKGIEVITQKESELMKTITGKPYGQPITLEDIDPEGRLKFIDGKFVMEVTDE
jgi:hypothetical protein